MPKYTLNQFFVTVSRAICTVASTAMLRRSASMRSAQLLFDESTNGIADCLFLRSDADDALCLDGNYHLVRCAAGGWLLHARHSTEPSYWLPTPAMLRNISAQGHILKERTAELNEFELDSSGVAITFPSIPEGWTLDAVIWRLADASLIDELQIFAPIETQGYFLLGSHTRYCRPADLYRHLIHGWVYEDRYAWPHMRRICSENDAHALHLILSGLQCATGKRIYGLLKNPVAAIGTVASE